MIYRLFYPPVNELEVLDTGSNPLLSTSNGFLGNHSVVFIASSSSELVDVQFVTKLFLLGQRSI